MNYHTSRSLSRICPFIHLPVHRPLFSWYFSCFPFSDYYMFPSFPFLFHFLLVFCFSLLNSFRFSFHPIILPCILPFPCSHLCYSTRTLTVGHTFKLNTSFHVHQLLSSCCFFLAGFSHFYLCHFLKSFRPRRKDGRHTATKWGRHNVRVLNTRASFIKLHIRAIMVMIMMANAGGSNPTGA
jgi:hypothetical protein